MKRSLILTLVMSLIAVSGANAQGFFENFSKDLRYAFSLGIGSAYPFNPNSFEANYDPSFGMMLDLGAAKQWVEASGTFDYSFFMNNGTTPDDANIMTLFMTVKVKPLKTSVRPYILVTGGWFRYWIVNLDITENVIGYGGGVGIEVEIGKTRRLFLEAKHVQGQTRSTEQQANTEIIPVRFGVTWSFGG